MALEFQKRQVTEKEFTAWVNAYPVSLRKSVCGIFEPPQVIFYPADSKDALKDAVAWHDLDNGGIETHQLRYFVLEPKG